MKLFRRCWNAISAGFLLFAALSIQCAMIGTAVVEMTREPPPPRDLSQTVIPSNDPDISGTVVPGDAEPVKIDMGRPIYVKAKMPEYDPNPRYSSPDPWITLGLAVRGSDGSYLPLIMKHHDFSKKSGQTVTLQMHEPPGISLEEVEADDSGLFEEMQRISDLEPGKEYQGYISLMRRRMGSISDEQSHQIVFTVPAEVIAHAQSIVDMEEQLKTAKAEKDFAERKQPGELTGDAKLKRDIIAANKSYGAKGQPQKVRVMSDWIIERHEYTGVVTGRMRFASVSYRRGDGSCYYASAYYRQDHDGSGFGKAYMHSGWGPSDPGSVWDMDCDNI